MFVRQLGAKLDEADRPMARVMLFAPELVVVVAETVVEAPVSRPDMAAVISIDFIVALVIGIFSFRISCDGCPAIRVCCATGIAS